MGRSAPTRRIGVAIFAVLMTVAGARAEDADLFSAAAAGAVLEVPAAAPNIDPAPIGTVKSDPNAPPEPQLPPEAPAATSGDAEPPPPSTADRLPFAIDALMARPGGLIALGAGNWRAAREAVQEFYVSRHFVPAWTDAGGLTSAGRSALERISRAADDGLDLAGLALPPPDFVSIDADALAKAEVDIADAVVVYALEASGARIRPSSISPLVADGAEVANPLAALAAVAAAPDPDAALQAFNPPQEAYRRLRDKLSQLPAPKAMTRAAERASLEPESARLIRSRLGEAEYVGAHGRRFAAAGVSDAVNVALAGGDEPRRLAILANMEMWRWEPRDMGASRVEINVPDYSLSLFENGAESARARVIVGKPDTPTPIFSGAIKYLVVNPIWRVPESIVKKEMLPHLAADPDYLARHGYTVKYVGNQMFVEQPPGQDNALGRILFMFPNSFSVYLHDTPARGLFAAQRRAFSHGCIRVEEPMKLAVAVMGGAANGWSTKKVEGLIGPNERAVFVPAPLPIHIEYFTEFVDSGGALRERDDIYGLTARVAATLSRLGQD